MSKLRKVWVLLAFIVMAGVILIELTRTVRPVGPSELAICVRGRHGPDAEYARVRRYVQVSWDTEAACHEVLHDLQGGRPPTAPELFCSRTPKCPD